MAAREESTSERGLSARCISLLEEVKEIIEGRRDPATNITTNGYDTSAQRHACEGAQTTEVSQFDPEPRCQRVIQILGRCFPLTQLDLFPDHLRLQGTIRIGHHRQRSQRRPGFFQLKETWTHDFFCLASKTASIVSPRSEKIRLQNAGLGRRKVAFPCRASAVDVLKVLEKVYPKLKQGDGFELLRSGSPASLLSLISPPAGGYSVPFLRDAAGLGQALAYIRPLQKDLPMHAPVENTEQVLKYYFKGLNSTNE